MDAPARRQLRALNPDPLTQTSSQTRLIVVNFALFNANINTFCVVQLSFELLETGGVVPSASFRTSRLLQYEADYGLAQLAPLTLTRTLTRTRAQVRGRPRARTAGARRLAHHVRRLAHAACAVACVRGHGRRDDLRVRLEVVGGARLAFDGVAHPREDIAAAFERWKEPRSGLSPGYNSHRHLKQQRRLLQFSPDVPADPPAKGNSCENNPNKRCRERHLGSDHLRRVRVPQITLTSPEDVNDSVEVSVLYAARQGQAERVGR